MDPVIYQDPSYIYIYIYIYIYSETYLRLIGGPSGAKFEPEALKDPLGLLRAPARAPKS